MPYLKKKTYKRLPIIKSIFYYPVMWNCVEWEQKYMEFVNQCHLTLRLMSLDTNDKKMSLACLHFADTIYLPRCQPLQRTSCYSLFLWCYLKFQLKRLTLAFLVNSVRWWFLFVLWIWSAPLKDSWVHGLVPRRWFLYRKHWKLQNMEPRRRGEVTGVQVPLCLLLWFPDALI